MLEVVGHQEQVLVETHPELAEVLVSWVLLLLVVVPQVVVRLDLETAMAQVLAEPRVVKEPVTSINHSRKKNLMAEEVAAADIEIPQMRVVPARRNQDLEVALTAELEDILATREHLVHGAAEVEAVAVFEPTLMNLFKPVREDLEVMAL